jgi:hypothetical protein
MPSLLGIDDDVPPKCYGVYGLSTRGGYGVYAYSNNADGVHGRSTGAPGVLGESEKNVGVMGRGYTNAGVAGQSDSSEGVRGFSSSGPGVSGYSYHSAYAGVFGVSYDGVGVDGASFSNADGAWSGSIMDSEFRSYSIEGYGDETIPITCNEGQYGLGTYSLAIQKMEESGTLSVAVVQDGQVLKETSTSAAYGVVSLAGEC